MIWALRNWQLVLIMALAFVAGAMGIRSAWLSDRLERAQTRARELEAYRTTRERIDNAPVPPSADAARDWLRKRKP